MAVRKGYKLTEIGEIPEDWEVKKIKDIACIDPELLSSNTPRNYSFQYISLEDVKDGILKSYEQQIFCTAPSRARKKIQYGDILFGTVRPNLHSHLLFSMAGADWVCSTGFTVLRTCEGYDNRLIFHNFFPKIFDRQINSIISGSNYPAINTNQVINLYLPIPSSNQEQAAIASALSDIDSLIASLEQLIAKKRLIKQGAMQELLTGKKRLPGFDGEWENVIADNHGIFIRGITYDPNQDLFSKYNKYGAILLRANNIKNNTINFSDIYYINKGIIGERQILVNGDILFCMANGSKKLVGKSASYNGKCTIPATFGAFMGVFRPFKNISDKNFIKYVFQSDLFINYINIILAGSAINNLTPNNILKFNFPMPIDFTEQAAIASVLSDMDDEIVALEAKLEKTRQIRAGMMEELLTGRIRLV